MTGKHYLYRHIRLDTSQPFYIGIGTKRKDRPITTELTEYHRAYAKNRRGDWWKRVVAKTGYEVEIIMESDDYEFIKQKEIEFIALYGRKNLNSGILINMTDGGDGNIGKVWTEEERKAISDRQRGDKNPMYGRTGKDNPQYGIPKSPESILRYVEIMKGRWPHSKEVINTLTGETWESGNEAARKNNINKATMKAYLNKRSNAHPEFMYLEKYLKISGNEGVRAYAE